MDAQTKAKFRKLIREDVDFAQKVFKDKDLYQAIYGDDPANTTADVSNNWQTDPKYLKDTKGLFAPMLNSLNKEAKPYAIASLVFTALFFLCVISAFFVFPNKPSDSMTGLVFLFVAGAISIILASILGQIASNKEVVPMYRAFKKQWLKQFSSK
ncbi:hypothetical protein [Fangia hongkongensis]|uniref:hypothetical protein n=1 Tax=Fangia hongkongensis TaxID=270495 RepID=UPI000365F81A|nr:hypothetical protein [Fangia hongkongensis]MBK2125046.1 hypothetical protein [Fangia hongkongensis]